MRNIPCLVYSCFTNLHQLTLVYKQCHVEYEYKQTEPSRKQVFREATTCLVLPRHTGSDELSSILLPLTPQSLQQALVKCSTIPKTSKLHVEAIAISRLFVLLGGASRYDVSEHEAKHSRRTQSFFPRFILLYLYRAPQPPKGPTSQALNLID